MTKPYYKLNFPVPTDKLLSPTFTLPVTQFDTNNPYIPVEKDAFGNALNCSSHNRWIHRFSGPLSGQQYVPILDILSTELVEYMESLGFDIGCIFIFYACPGSWPGGIHADWGNTTTGKDANFAINWTLGAPGGSSMIWYEPIDTTVDDSGWPINATPAALAYPIPTWNKKYVREIARYSINGPTLVRTDIPHNAVNYSKVPRWCFSIRTNWHINNWQEAVDKFSNICIEE